MNYQVGDLVSHSKMGGIAIITGIAVDDRLQAIGLLPSSFPTPGAFIGLVPTVNFAYMVLNSSSASNLR